MNAGTDPSAASITADVIERLRADILSGHLAPGSRLKIDDLRGRYGVGASPIREGLSLLVSDGLVERLHQRGFRVKAASLAAFQELLQTREWIEERALRESIARGDSKWEENVLLAHHRLKRQPRWLSNNGEVRNPQWEVLHRQFHLVLIGASGSSILTRYCEQLYDQNVRYRQLAAAGRSGGRAADKEHAALCEAILGRDADASVRLLLRHYRTTGDALCARLAESPHLQGH